MAEIKFCNSVRPLIICAKIYYGSSLFLIKFRISNPIETSSRAGERTLTNNMTFDVLVAAGSNPIVGVLESDC
jgi:hypothetical protein